MAKTILVSRYGPGISNAVAERFGREGFAVALAARNADRLNAGVEALKAKGIAAAAFPCDVGDPAAAAALVGRVRDAMGPLTAIEWTAYSGAAGDLLAADPAEVRAVLDVATVGLLAAIRAALPDLQARAGGVLIVNGSLGLSDPTIDATAVQWNAMGLAVANAAKHKLVGLLAQKLAPAGVYVGEAIVYGLVKRTSFDAGNATIDPGAVAGALWDLYRLRTELTVDIR
jgi:NADP-dependent 3-hydroxy acid dehydrogenase YdfG